jgi:hypothetical protein
VENDRDEHWGSHPKITFIAGRSSILTRDVAVIGTFDHFFLFFSFFVFPSGPKLYVASVAVEGFHMLVFFGIGHNNWLGIFEDFVNWAKIFG